MAEMDGAKMQKMPHIEAMYSFSVPEYIKYDRGIFWYCVTGALAIGGLVYALMTTNYLFGFIILLLGFIIIARDFRQPRMNTLQLTDEGIYHNERFTPFHQLGSFWIVYDPPITKQLYLKKRNSNDTVIIPFEDVDPVEMRQWMRNKVRENLDEKDETLMEIWSRLLKI